MREYAEVYRGFVVGFHKRSDMRRPEFSGRLAVRVDMLVTPPEVGWYFDGRRFAAPDPATQPRNSNLDPPPATDRQVLEETRDAVNRIIDWINTGTMP